MTRCSECARLISPRRWKHEESQRVHTDEWDLCKRHYRDLLEALRAERMRQDQQVCAIFYT